MLQHSQPTHARNEQNERGARKKKQNKNETTMNGRGNAQRTLAFNAHFDGKFEIISPCLVSESLCIPFEPF